MSAGDQNYSRAAQFECLSDPTVPLSVWIALSGIRFLFLIFARYSQRS
jgi:hypothetical protein